MGLIKAKIHTPSKLVKLDMDDPIYLDHPEKIQEDIENEPIRYLELVKHFPYHTEDRQVWVDQEFGELLGLEHLEPSEANSKDNRDAVQYWPDLEYMVSIPGKGFRRDVAICATQELADEWESKILGLDKIQEVTAEKRHYDLIKKVVAVVK